MQKPEQWGDLPKVTELVSGGVMTQAQMIWGLSCTVLSGTNPVSLLLQSRTPQLKGPHLPHVSIPGRGLWPPPETDVLDWAPHGYCSLLLYSWASLLICKMGGHTFVEHLLCDTFFCFVFWLHHMACRIFMSPPQTEPGPQHQQHQVLTTGLPGNSITCHI